ncbi:MAG TPA: YXWGXW repeat-containing protein [Opitutaceae bacterium]|jgi:hypothetical protein
MKLNHLLSFALLAGLPMAASAQIGFGVNVRITAAPPPMRAEIIPAAPGPGYVWVRGHWAWRHGWVWMPGSYQYRPGYNWVPGHWDSRGGEYVWVEGHWAGAVAVQAPPRAVVEAHPPVPQGEVVVNAPPPLQTEIVTVSPGPEYVWIGGHWGWSRRHWVWVGGYWAHRHHPGAVWIGGHWDRRPGGYVWVEGRWR